MKTPCLFVCVCVHRCNLVQPAQMNAILKTIIPGQTVPWRSLAQSGEASTAGAPRRARGARPSLPAAAHTAQALPAAVGSGLLGGSAALSGDRNPDRDLSGVWRALAEEPQGRSPAQGKASASSLKRTRKCGLQIYQSMKPRSLQSFFFFRLVQQPWDTPSKSVFPPVLSSFSYEGKEPEARREQRPLRRLASGRGAARLPARLLTRCQQG